MSATAAVAAVITAPALVTPAEAQQRQEQPIRLELGGYFMAYFMGGDQERRLNKPGNGFRNHGIARESEIFFLGSTQLDNGLVVGARIELEGETSADQIDETFMFFEHVRYGRLEAGQTKSAANKMFYGAPDPVPGFGFNSPTFNTIQPGFNTALSNTYIQIGASGDEEKLTIFTPQMYGVQFGISYTPNGCEASTAAPACVPAGDGFQNKQNIGRMSKVVEMALSYTESFGDFDLGAYAGGGFGRVEQNGVNGEFQNRKQWGLGWVGSYAGVTLGMSYRWDNVGFRRGTLGNDPLNLQPTTQQDFNIGAVYQFGPWTVGAQYHRTWVQLTDDTNNRFERKDKFDGVIVGGTYLLGPGIQLAGGVEWRNFRGPDRTPASQRNDAENEGVTFVLGSVLSF